MEKKKNVAALVRAFGEFSDKLSKRNGKKYTLALAGSEGYGWEEIEKEIAGGLQNKGRVARLGRVDEKDVPMLISGASCYVFPSFYEGFGIPALQALACGTLLVASDIGALREVAGGCAFYADPFSDDALSTALERACGLDDSSREQARARGIERAFEFSWSKTADIMWQVIHSLV